MTALAPEAPAPATRSASERTADELGLRPGWITIAGKEFADHLLSVRFYVLLIVLGIAALIPLYFAAERIRSLASEVRAAPRRSSSRCSSLGPEGNFGPIAFTVQALRRDRGAAARRRLRIRRRERRAPPGHPAEAPLPADPP